MDKLYRSKNNKVLGGVCGGMGPHYGIDPNIIRIVWLIVCFFWGIGILAYIVAWIILPLQPDESVIEADYTVKE